MSIRSAIILAAGRGERLRPITDRIPKPMVEVGGRAMIDRALDQLLRFGITRAVVNISYKAEMLTSHLATRRVPSIQIFHEVQPLETGGGILKALPLLGNDSFFALNSDTICVDKGKVALARLEEAWEQGGADIMLLLHPVDRAIGYYGKGDFFLENDGRLRRRQGDEKAPYVFTGIQILQPELFKDCPPGAFSMNLLYDRDSEGDGRLSPRLRAIVHEGDWLHVGDPQGLEQAEDYFRG